MEQWQQRLKAEAEELEIKIEKLLDFLSTKQFNDLDGVNKTLLHVQFRAMQAYYEAVEGRMEINDIR
jgi:hypothetical protein